MAESSPNFRTWSSSSEAANSLCYKLGNSFDMDSAGSMDADELAWQQLSERVTALNYPTRIQMQRPDMLGSVDSRYGQVFQFHSGYNHDVSTDLPLNGFPELSITDRIPNRPESLPEAVFPSLEPPVEAPRKIRTGRRRRSSESTPDGWVASKNLISERRRREKLQKGLITLRELVPMFNQKMDRVSILTDAINHLQDLKRQVETLESTDSHDEDRRTFDLKTVEVTKSSSTDVGTSYGDNEGENQKNSSTDGSFCSEFIDNSVVRCEYETSPASSRDWDLQLIQLDVVKLDHGVYKLDLICMEQSGILVQLSQAIEAFVIEIVYTSIVVITSAKVTCTFIVKMSSWNDMTLEEVRADIKKLLGKSGLQFS
ncbi:hypothetical protein KC19_5G090400 [Ceratodon purpureus]|uniref:BHLH domain-containing protein n=1 Tax=Ceratodon purpureus TaxID=3225 RepID=A0A8T0HZF2_CERPU|nr:hypothetical protein KC19_5G090400 [Ceratodon purpureus]